MSIRSFRHISPDQRTGFVSALIAIVTLIITAISPYFIWIVPVAIIIGVALLFVYMQTIVRKVLYFEFVDLHSVLEKLTFNAPSIEKRISIFYDNTEVAIGQQLYTLLLNIHNEGNSLIEEKDFCKRPILIELPSTVKLLDATGRDSSLPNNTHYKSEGNTFTIPPFSLAVHKSFKIRITLSCAALKPVEELKHIKIPPKGKDGTADDFKFKIIENRNKWEEKLGKKARRRGRLLFTSLLILSFFSLVVWAYIWFFPDSGILAFHLTLQYQLLLTILLTIPYFGLILSMLFNRIAPSSTT